jgi:hypothetical protein
MSGHEPIRNFNDPKNSLRRAAKLRRDYRCLWQVRATENRLRRTVDRPTSLTRKRRNQRFPSLALQACRHTPLAARIGENFGKRRKRRKRASSRGSLKLIRRRC